MESYATQFLAESNSGEIRSQAAYLAGALNMTSEVTRVKSIVANSAYGDIRLEAAYGLAYLLTVTEFESTIDASDLRSWDKSLAKRLNSFLQADDAGKDAAISAMLSNSEFVMPLAVLAQNTSIS